MSAPTLLNLLPREAIQPLKDLGKHDWVSWRQVDGALPRTEFRLRLPDDPQVDRHETFLEGVQRMAGADRTWLLKMFAYSKLIVSGPKVLQPTADQCSALEHVDVNLPFSEYEQPFPVFLVELSEVYRRTMTQRFSYRCPRFVMAFHDRPSGYILTSCEDGPDRGCPLTIMSPRPCWENIEDALRYSADVDGPDLRLAEVLYRVAINFGLLLTRYGAKDCGPVDPQDYAEQKRRAKARKGHKARRARELLDAAMRRIDFQQEVVFYESVKPHAASPDGEGSMKRPHWRRGHFRRQPCGPGRTDRRLIFVRPCFINAEHFHGDTADTEYRIKAHDVPRNGVA